LFSTEEAYSHDRLQTRKLGQGPNCYSAKFEYAKSDADMNQPITIGSKRTQTQTTLFVSGTKTKSISCLKLNLTSEKIMYGGGQLKTIDFLVL
jgi:hypothetical protein